LNRPRPTRLPLPPSPFPTSTNSKRSLAVAITGGIGAGKSAALDAFARHGAATISSDEIVHRLYREDPEVRDALIERFGTTDRAAIAGIVFDDPGELEWLEALLHPRVVRAYEVWAADQTAQLTVTEIPLLYETGAEKRFDVVVVITAPPELRAKRRPVADTREERLLADEDKVRAADYAYVNDGTLEDLDAFVADVTAKLTV
jgi:dephospho-CoA kinase